MVLLLNSSIEQKINQNIKGSVARIGGHVDQVINYKNCKITDINVKDGGFGIINRSTDIKSLSMLYRAAIRLVRQELAYYLKGRKGQRDRKTALMDMHFAFKNNKYKHYFDASISSNVIEHSPNPIFLLLNFYFITKEGGYQFHAIPNFRYTYDSFRKPTPVEHIIEDFENMIWFDDNTHNEDYINSAIIKHGYQKEFHKKYPVAYPFMHFHVFDENNVREMVEFIFEDVTVDIIRTKDFSDNLIFFRNKLKAEFTAKFSSKIEEYYNLV